MRKKTFNRTLLLFSVKVILFRVIIFCKRKWQNLVNSAINAHNFNGIKNKWKSRSAVFLIGLCNCIASTPFSVIIILPLTFGSLFFILDECKYDKIKTQISIIFFFIFGYFVSIFWWVFSPFTANLRAIGWIMPIGVIFVPLLSSLMFLPFFIIGMIVWNKIFKTRRYETLYFVLIFCICWYCGDYVRGHYLFGGFPWMMFGHFITSPILMQSVKFFGIDLYSIFILLCVITPYLWVFKKKVNNRKFCLSIVALFCINLLYGILCIYLVKQEPLPQVNIIGAQSNKPALYGNESNEIYEKYLNKKLELISWIANTKQPSIILLPEGSIYYQDYSNDNIFNVLSKYIPNEKSLMLVGGIYYEGVSVYNSIFSLTNAGDIISTYKKQKLVPFGEYIPFRKYLPFFVRDITGGAMDISTHKYNDFFVFYRDLPYLYPIICYESIFPEMVKKNIEQSRINILNMDNEYKRRNNIKDIKDRGELIINLTNDSWLRYGIGGYQHLLMSRYLAIITGISVVRVSDNGISALIDKFGRIVEKTKFNEEDIFFVKNTFNKK